MLKRNLVIASVAVITISLIVITTIYKTVNAKNDEDIRILDYKASETVSERGVQLDKFQNLNAIQWLNENKLLVFNNDYKNNILSDFPERNSISVYDINTKEYVHYNNLSINPDRIHGVSPSGRFLLYSEPKRIPEINSQAWKNAISSGDIYKECIDILDLETKEIIKGFDKNEKNYEAQYKWLNDEKIYVNYGSHWKILNINGESIKEGKFNFNGCDDTFATLIDISELKEINGEITGSFYYSKTVIGPDRNLGLNIYSMDVNKLEEEFIFNSYYSIKCIKNGSVFVADTLSNNGAAVDGRYINRIFGFNIFNLDGTLKQNINLQKERNKDCMALSPNGNKLLYKEVDVENDNNISDASNDSLKIVDISSGNVSEILNIEGLMDKDREERFCNYKKFDSDNTERIIQRRGPNISNILWDPTGTSVMFNYEYTSKIDGENYIDTYILTYDD